MPADELFKAIGNLSCGLFPELFIHQFHFVLRVLFVTSGLFYTDRAINNAQEEKFSYLVLISNIQERVFP
jgi:hypothetical protein